MKIRLLCICGLVILFIFSGLSLSYAKDKTDSSKVIRVPEGHTVDNFFSIGHNAVIDGTVRNLVLVVGGDLHVHSTAKVKELIIVIDGSVIQDPGTHVTENLVAFAWNKRVMDAFLFGGAILLSSWVVKLILALIIIIVSTIGALLVPDSFNKEDLFGSWKLWLTGLIAGVWLVILVVLLAITIIGIPFALLLLLLPAFGFFMVSGRMSRELGRRILPARSENWLTSLVGAFFLTALLEFPLVGFLLALGLLILSMGHLILFIAGFWQRRKRTA
ncbi:hypothetical protein PU629_17870 [Pullulanibacillus sp. KACC 23026]|uniref:hypothetical protein n=1 Tax=Pullulanibacillus sp. KACC 23026 TaxID=3028315 RepID=UPI0023B11355|nr:hypothetical protein [Pullulanibacillus sp. KACC 23026]WEG11974.1 hypothetical protein PU629_17870 [Pullulanibacillus sp. KACC 23026]